MTQTLTKENAVTAIDISLNDLVDFERVITNLDRNTNKPPEHLPESINDVVVEANKCLSAQCWNAAGAMYRLALDLSTKELLPDQGEPAAKVRRNLGLRLPWLFDKGLLPADLKSLAECLQQDGNDGAHDGTLQKEDAEDLHDFTFELLRRLYTEPARVRIANDRRIERRNSG